MSSPANLRPARSNAAHLAALVIQRTGDVVRIAEKTAGPLLDLFIRLWLADIFWAVLFTWFAVKGAGPISLDALIGRGITATALPLAATIARCFDLLTRWGDPAIKLLLRCWIAALFFRSGVMKISNLDMTQMLFHARSAQWLLPPELAARLTILLELGCLIFLVLGAGTRITAILLIGLVTVVDPTFQHQ